MADKVFSISEANLKRIRSWQDEVGNDNLTDWDVLEMAIDIFKSIESDARWIPGGVK